MTGRGSYIGKTDPPLSQAGFGQAQKLACRLNTWKMDKVLSSPSLRAVETARRVVQGGGGYIEQDPDLREIDFGRWEGMSFAEIAAADPDLVSQWAMGRMDFCFPEGESLSAFWERIKRAGERIGHRQDEIVAAVTHGGVIRMLLCYFLGLDPRSHLMFEVSPGSITTVHLYRESAVLFGLNDRCHMEVGSNG
jgi:broad specificity phosphatase PhoE